MPMKMRLTVVIPFVYFVCRLFACGRIHTKREMVNNFCGFSRSPWLLIHFIFNAENIWCFGDEKLDAFHCSRIIPIEKWYNITFFRGWIQHFLAFNIYMHLLCRYYNIEWNFFFIIWHWQRYSKRSETTWNRARKKDNAPLHNHVNSSYFSSTGYR